ncbi:hypothetical protein DM02DRAFT_306832 [Periconia macrospinosa]|uniref:DUF1168-domain-containing protein n=1 Tax=Periconia macrospinosa TaxID=97972 RepID=A0A2V1DVR5_9PLEO|nr:hypothetical protein DM02DRAFT_306832 [Periconia macrospinosa]
MSEPIPEAIPTSADPRSKRPIKKARSSNPVRDAQAAQVEALFAKPDREIRIPPSTALTASKSNVPAPPEIVANVQGSSAGAGSGEFHVYKASRRREYERLRLMDEEVKREEDEKAAREKKEEIERRDRERTEKNRSKREKARLRKEKAKMGKKNGGGEGKEGGAEATAVKKKLVPNARKAQEDGDGDKDGNREGDKDDDAVLNGGGEVKNADEVGLVIEDDD